MVITNEQRIERRRHIGSSDSPAILGVCPFRTPYDVWLSKVSDRELAVPEKISKRMEVGTVLEEGLLIHMEKKHGVRLKRSQHAVAEDGVLAANFDGICQDFVVECKVTSTPELWYGGLPEHVKVQVQHQLYVSGLSRGLVVALFLDDPPSINEYEVSRDERLISRIRRECLHFWRTFVVPRKPPPGAPPYDPVSNIPESLLSDYCKACESRDKASSLRKLIISLLGKARQVTVGKYQVDLSMRIRTRFDAKAFAEDHPELYQKYLADYVTTVLSVRRLEHGGVEASAE